MAAEDIVIVGAARTAVGSFGGVFNTVPAHDLGAVAIKAALERAGVSPDDVDEVIFGQVLTAGAGQNPARQAAIKAGIPEKATAWGVNQVCGSGLRTVAIGMQQIANGDATVIVAGGQESMSLSPHAQYLRGGQKMGDVKLVDTMIKDGLWDAFNGYHMGTTAENVAQAVAAHPRGAGRVRDALAEQGRGRPQGRPLQGGDLPRHRAGPQGRHHRRHRRVHPRRRHGRGHGQAEARLLEGRHRDGRQRLGSQRRGRRDRADVGVRGRAPGHHAARPDRLLGHGRRRPEGHGHRPDPGLAQGPRQGRLEGLPTSTSIEANEAFAAQALAVNKDMGWDTDKVNVNGGAIAIGHPIGASGARVLVTLLHELKRRDAKKGLATLCIGGGMGVALCVERV